MIQLINKFLIGSSPSYTAEVPTTDDTTTQVTTTTEAATAQTSTTTTKPTTQAPESGPVGECPSDDSLVFLPDSVDCAIYYVCNWGTPVQMQCGIGLHFNPTLNVCDWPQNAGCSA